MHPEVSDWLNAVRAKHPVLFAGQRVLECGSYIINGSPRPLFAGGEYVGLDWRAGPGVDVVSLCHEYRPAQPFDVIISTQMLEHDPYWADSLRNMLAMLRPGGALLLSFPGASWPKHEVDCAPVEGHYRNVTHDEVIAIIGDHFAAIESAASGMDNFVVALNRKGAGGRPAVDFMTAPGLSMTPGERLLLRSLAQQAALKFGPRCLMINIGVGPGASCWCLRAGAPDARLIGLDVDPSSEGGDWTFIHADSRRYHARVQEPVALLFVDGDHDYHGVKADIANWGPKVAPGGWMVFHDYAPDLETARHAGGVRVAIDESMGDGWEAIATADSIKAFRRDTGARAPGGTGV